MTSNRAFSKARLFFCTLAGQDCPVAPTGFQYSSILDLSIELFDILVQSCSRPSYRAVRYLRAGGNEIALWSATLFILLVFDG